MTNPMTMVERVARAIQNVDIIAATGATIADDAWQKLWADDTMRAMTEPYARAAIAAMREPTRQMADAAYERQRSLNCAVQTGLNYSAIYETMIDTALSEHKTQTRKG
jgi:hypothetical protein